jgi:hypothetical protein
METINQNEDLAKEKVKKEAAERARQAATATQQTIDDIPTFESELDAEILNASMFKKYQINTRFNTLMQKEPLVGTITKIAGWRGSEELVIRTKILHWTMDIRPRTKADRDYIEFKGVNHKFTGTLSELIGNKSGQPYWGIRFELRKGDTINYALTHGDMRILEDLSVFRLREVK